MQNMKYNIALMTALCTGIAGISWAQETIDNNIESEVVTPSEITPEQRLEGQKSLRRDIDFAARKKEPKEIEEIVNAMNAAQKIEIRRQNRLLPPEQKVKFEKITVNTKDKNNVKEVLENVYVTQSEKALNTESQDQTENTNQE